VHEIYRTALEPREQPLTFCGSSTLLQKRVLPSAARDQGCHVRSQSPRHTVPVPMGSSHSISAFGAPSKPVALAYRDPTSVDVNLALDMDHAINCPATYSLQRNATRRVIVFRETILITRASSVIEKVCVVN
jgi:hypothetical protein